MWSKKKGYLECKHVERALLRHVQDALEEKRIEALIDDHTNLIMSEIKKSYAVFIKDAN